VGISRAIEALCAPTFCCLVDLTEHRLLKT